MIVTRKLNHFLTLILKHLLKRILSSILIVTRKLTHLQRLILSWKQTVM